MTKAAICFATAFCAVYATGCSSSSSNNDGGTNNDAAMVVLADGSGNQLKSPPGGACPGLPCTSPQVCCFNPLSNTGQCQDPSAMCGGVVTACSTPSDCTAPQVCCGRGTGRGGGPAGGFMVSCVDTSMCMSTGGGFAFQLCDSTHGCPTGDRCIAAFGGRMGGGGSSGGMMGGGGMICLNPEAGFPGFGMMDAGTSSDAGAPDTGAADTGAVDTGADVTATDTGASDAGSDAPSPTDGGAG